jgi:2-iminobutanoate/2-iminopropanoate deaminase
MADGVITAPQLSIDPARLTDPERGEMIKLGILTAEGTLLSYTLTPPPPDRLPPICKRAIHAPRVLNEAFHYAKPSSFSRGLLIDLGMYTLLLISGTASVDENGKTVHVGDFGAQCWRTYRNISSLLESENATWPDVIRTTCYLRDIERDYRQFNEIRTYFFSWLGLNPFPASVGVQARLCREDLLVEIEAVALFQRRGGTGKGAAQ